MVFSDYSIRIDLKDFEKKKLEDLIKIFVARADASQYLIVFEIAKKTQKPHYHVFLKTMHTQKSVRNKFNYLFPTHKGNDYACKHAKKPENLLSYLMKDGNVVATSFSDAELKAIPEWKDMSKSNMLTILKSEVKETVLKDIFFHVMSVLDDHNRLFMKHVIKGYVWTLYYHNNKIKKGTAGYNTYLNDMWDNFFLT